MSDLILRLEGKIYDIPRWIWILIIIFILLFIAGKMYDKKKQNRKKYDGRQKDISANFGESGYSDEILRSLPENIRLDYSYLYNRINDLQYLIDKYQSALDSQKIEAENAINRQIVDAQSQIEKKWKDLKRKGDFYHYIYLHYASFTLADNIKREQEVLRSSFVYAKNKCDELGKEIERLNREIPNSHGTKGYELKQRHKQLCEQHKRAAKLKGVFGSRNTQYLNMVKEQNRKTAWYREYIICNCGSRGRAWGNRLKKKKIDQISYN